MPNNWFDDFYKIYIEQRSEFIDKLVSFVAQDTILFLDDCKGASEKIKEVNQLLGTNFLICEGIEVKEQNLIERDKVAVYLNSISLEKAALIYLVATEIRSVLSAILFAEVKISATDLFNLTFYEELEQQKVWGITDEIVYRHSQIKERLSYLEKVRNERSLS